jgi:hypothetical protein
MINDENERVPAVANRSQEFGTGLVGGQVSPPESLQQEATRYNAATPKVYQPSGSGIGMSSSQAQATFGGLFGVGNGSSAQTWETKRYFERSPG